jgi:hypothetical protein
VGCSGRQQRCILIPVVCVLCAISVGVRGGERGRILGSEGGGGLMRSGDQGTKSESV